MGVGPYFHIDGHGLALQKEEVVQPKVQSIKGGWAVVGDGWAVFAESRDAAMKKYREAEVLHDEIVKRPVRDKPGVAGTDGSQNA